MKYCSVKLIWLVVLLASTCLLAESEAPVTVVTKTNDNVDITSEVISEVNNVVPEDEDTDGVDEGEEVQEGMEDTTSGEFLNTAEVNDNIIPKIENTSQVSPEEDSSITEKGYQVFRIFLILTILVHVEIKI